jgi:two-component system, cell cycle sensor histidine kinase and response regulator CckA
LRRLSEGESESAAKDNVLLLYFRALELRARNTAEMAVLSNADTALSQCSAEVLFGALEDVLPNFVVVTDLDGAIARTNRLPPGTTAEMFLGVTLAALTDASYQNAVRNCFAEVRSTLKPSYYEATGDIPGLSGREARVRVGPICEAGVLLGFVAVLYDNTFRKESERALREQTDKLRVAADAAKLGMWSLELQTGAMVWDARTCEAFGVRVAPPSTDAFNALVHPEDRALLNQTVEHAIATGTYVPLEHRIIRPNGEERWLYCCARVLEEQGKSVRFLGGVVDVTERRALDAQVRFTQKSEAVGQLTSGLAHNFNNMLAGMLPVLDMVESRVEEPWRTRVQSARHAGERAAEMVRQLMTFARPDRDRPRRADSLSQLCTGAVRICHEAFGSRVEIILENETPDAVIRADGGQIEQVLVNLLLNARDAVANVAQASVKVVVTAVDPGSPDALSLARAEGVTLASSVRVRVSDNGTGMPRDVLARVFEPFFTTKPVGKGTGLGLATAHAIIRDHGGFIVCASTLGIGTHFDIYLPITSEHETRSRRAPPSSSKLSAKIMVIDDDATVRAIVADILSEAGYRVSVAEGGESALARLDVESPDVVLLDHSMQGQLGSVISRTLRSLRPNLKIVRFSGHSESELEGFVSDTVLAKPASRDQILDAINAVL